MFLTFLMCAAMLRQSRTSKRSSALDAADVACSCILAGMSVSSTVAFPSSILLAPLLPFSSLRGSLLEALFARTALCDWLGTGLGSGDDASSPGHRFAPFVGGCRIGTDFTLARPRQRDVLTRIRNKKQLDVLTTTSTQRRIGDRALEAQALRPPAGFENGGDAVACRVLCFLPLNLI